MIANLPCVNWTVSAAPSFKPFAVSGELRRRFCLPSFSCHVTSGIILFFPWMTFLSSPYAGQAVVLCLFFCFSTSIARGEKRSLANLSQFLNRGFATDVCLAVRHLYQNYQNL
ncbi:hypothetical protein Pcar_3192 [Syntrophotalea carbinolica DSM 2380]|uniref:Uncharacterized protein n=2 Tax=Syntrophotalea carbinolica TaxID=19 RepID=Q0C6X5_SYNC1|nr:hypothetical protein Pcar_3192 [Syntrophotalea carbinolica DSM 2380]